MRGKGVDVMRDVVVVCPPLTDYTLHLHLNKKKDEKKNEIRNWEAYDAGQSCRPTDITPLPQAGCI